MPAYARDMIVVPANTDAVQAKIVFSALHTEIANELEPAFAKAGAAVCSNASSYRRGEDVPSHHAELPAGRLCRQHLARVEPMAGRCRGSVLRASGAVGGLAAASVCPRHGGRRGCAGRYPAFGPAGRCTGLCRDGLQLLLGRTACRLCRASRRDGRKGCSAPPLADPVQGAFPLCAGSWRRWPDPQPEGAAAVSGLVADVAGRAEPDLLPAPPACAATCRAPCRADRCWWRWPC